jgi:hypothetical protein
MKARKIMRPTTTMVRRSVFIITPGLAAERYEPGERYALSARFRINPATL